VAGPGAPAGAFQTVALDLEGKVDQAKMRAFSPARDFSFDFQGPLLPPAREDG
jgi:hypothetical protein